MRTNKCPFWNKTLKFPVTFYRRETDKFINYFELSLSSTIRIKKKNIYETDNNRVGTKTMKMDVVKIKRTNVLLKILHVRPVRLSTKYGLYTLKTSST